MNRFYRHLLPLVILMVGLGVTWGAWHHERTLAAKALRSDFDYSLHEAVSRIEQRIAGYEQMLHGVQGLFVATGKFDRDVFRDYVTVLNLDANFSGVEAIGVEQLVTSAEKNQHIAAMRAAGLSEYTIYPEGERSVYAPIIIREPDMGRNRRSLGFDPYAEPTRHVAMSKARDSGQAIITDMVTLNADSEAEKKPSFVMYLPVYGHGKPQTTVEQRRASLIGWVHAAFRMADVMASLYGEWPQGVNFAIYDGVLPNPQALMYRSDSFAEQSEPVKMSGAEYLVLAGHNWLLEMSVSSRFSPYFAHDAEWRTAIGGVILSVLLALFARALIESRRRALYLANQMTSELRASEEQFRAIADCTVNWEIWWGLDGKPRWINPSVAGYTGYSVEECMAMPNLWAQLCHPEDLAKVVTSVGNGLQGGQGSDLEFRCIRKDGSVFWLLASWGPITNANGEFAGFRTSGRDITERKQAEDELRITAVAFDSIEGIMVSDPRSRILRVNYAFTQISGYPAEELIGKSSRRLRSDRHGSTFYRAIWESVRRTGGWQGELWSLRKSGRAYPAWMTISAVKDKDGLVTHYVSTHQDITERKIAEERIKELAFFDPLTRLPNRTPLLDRLKQAIVVSHRHKTCSALLFIDLDHFKTLNDTLGHDQGDHLLKQVALRLNASVRANDTVARVGGDEFVVVLEDLHQFSGEAATQTRLIGEKILSVLDAPYHLDQVEYRTTASVGATVFQGHECTIDELLKQADLAMYRAKESGRNALRFFNPEMQIAVIERADMEAGLRTAIAEQQLVLHYQAQLGADGRMSGAEVLGAGYIRSAVWCHRRGLFHWPRKPG